VALLVLLSHLLSASAPRPAWCAVPAVAGGSTGAKVVR
jgi:hypothetical protein